MIHIGTIESLYKKHEREFTHLVLEKKPLTHSSLILRYSDQKGKKYYGFQRAVDICLERLGKIKDYHTCIVKGLTGEEDEKIDDAIADAVMNLPTKEKIGIAVGAILAEKQSRREMSMHTEIFYNLVAVQLIREDENPEKFDEEMQQQKVDQFKADTKTGGTYGFFFRMPEFKKYFALLNMSPLEWEASWQDSQMKQKTLIPKLKIYSKSKTSSIKTETTSKVK